MNEFDYSGLAATAVRLITRFGREVQFQLIDLAPDPTPTVGKPWRPEDRRTPITPITHKAVQVPASGGGFGLQQMYQDLFEKSETVFITTPLGTTDLGQVMEVLEGDATYAVTMRERLKPGDTELIWLLGCGR